MEHLLFVYSTKKKIVKADCGVSFSSSSTSTGTNYHIMIRKAMGSEGKPDPKSHVDLSMFMIRNSDKYSIDGWQLSSGSGSIASKGYISDNYEYETDKYATIYQYRSKTQSSISTASSSTSSSSVSSSFTYDPFGYDSSFASDIISTESWSSDEMSSTSSLSISNKSHSNISSFGHVAKDIATKPVQYSPACFDTNDISGNPPLYKNKSCKKKNGGQQTIGNLCEQGDCSETIPELQLTLKHECHHFTENPVSPESLNSNRMRDIPDTQDSSNCYSSPTNITQTSSLKEILSVRNTIDSSYNKVSNCSEPFPSEQPLGAYGSRPTGTGDFYAEIISSSCRAARSLIPDENPSDENSVDNVALSTIGDANIFSMQRTDFEDEDSLKTIKLSLELPDVQVDNNEIVSHPRMKTYTKGSTRVAKSICFLHEFLDSVCGLYHLSCWPLCGIEGGNTSPTENVSRESSELNGSRIITLLYSAIHSKNTEKAMQRLLEYPEEAKIWVACCDSIADDGGIQPVQCLPLHTACLCNFSFEFIRKLIYIYPDAVRSRAGNLKYPIHIACEVGTEPSIVSLLIEQWPGSIYALDGENNIPLTNLIRSKPLSPRKSDIMKLLLAAFATFNGQKVRSTKIL